jgi:hypothetical protein
MITITLPSELESAVNKEAAEKGTTAELLTLGALQERFLTPSTAVEVPKGETLADALADYIGSIDTSNKYPNGSTLSENTGRQFGELMAKKRAQGKL